MILSDLVASIIVAAKSVADNKSNGNLLGSRIVNQVAQLLSAAWLHVNGNEEQFDSTRKALANKIKEDIAEPVWKASLASPFSNIAKCLTEYENAEGIAIAWSTCNFSTTVSEVMEAVKTPPDAAKALRKYLDKKIKDMGAEAVSEVFAAAVAASQVDNGLSGLLGEVIPVLVS